MALISEIAQIIVSDMLDVWARTVETMPVPSVLPG